MLQLPIELVNLFLKLFTRLLSFSALGQSILLLLGNDIDFGLCIRKFLVIISQLILDLLQLTFAGLQLRLSLVSISLGLLKIMDEVILALDELKLSFFLLVNGFLLYRRILFFKT